MTRVVSCFLLSTLLTGCSPAMMQGFAEGYAAAAGVGSTQLMLFGGPGHETYLGCLSCSEYASDSLFNEYSSYGSPYATTSIFNSYSQFGSAYSQYSACNPYASDPPVVVDEDGNYYGRLTVNAYHSEAFGDADVLAWLRGVCG